MRRCVCVPVSVCLISTSAIDCLGRFVSEMTYYVSSGTLNLTKPKPNPGVTSPQLQRLLFFSFVS